MTKHRWSWLVGAILLTRCSPSPVSNGISAGGETSAMSASVLIEWTKTGHEPEEAGGGTADVTVFTDGRVRLGPRLCGGKTTWRQLSRQEVAALRHFLFDELRILDIDGETVARNVEAAAAKRKEATDTESAELVTTAAMDAGTTILRAADQPNVHRRVRRYGISGRPKRRESIRTA